MQADFKALELLARLQELVQALVGPSSKPWHLYTTPPKQVSLKVPHGIHGS